MGQTVIIRDHVAVGDVLVVTTDRSFTGQDGQSMTPDSPGECRAGIAGGGAFSTSTSGSTTSTCSRTRSPSGGLGPGTAKLEARALDVISSFLRHYDESEEE